MCNYSYSLHGLNGLYLYAWSILIPNEPIQSFKISIIEIEYVALFAYAKSIQIGIKYSEHVIPNRIFVPRIAIEIYSSK